MKLTKAQRKAIRDAGPYYVERGYVLDNDGCTLNSYLSADVVAALNTIASEPESVAAARGRLLRAALIHDTYEPATEDVRPIRILEAAGTYQAALLAAKRAKRGRK
jgi:hypothetical protein